ncbi:MAG: C26 family cysteine hydrolase domain-containing family, partial [Acidimicrobiales bacterium]|nr:C26 family cysteine hydrolase domain-containing family [Acidimicrobiales bacterium]
MLRSKPIIGLSTYLEVAKWSSWDTKAAIIQKKYLDTVELADARPILLPPLDSDLAKGANDDEFSEAAREVIEVVDGIVLIGGGDVDSSIYGQEPNPQRYGVSPSRDAWEISLTKACIEMDKPLLGICRGMQIINVALG